MKRSALFIFWRRKPVFSTSSLLMPIQLSVCQVNQVFIREEKNVFSTTNANSSSLSEGSVMKVWFPTWLLMKPLHFVCFLLRCSQHWEARKETAVQVFIGEVLNVCFKCDLGSNKGIYKWKGVKKFVLHRMSISQFKFEVIFNIE